MGCDIHIVIQRQEADGEWREIVYQSAPWPHEVERGTAKPPIEGFPVAPHGFDGRSYDLFGILADVRNGSGFAGCLTGDGWPSIAPDRGWPEGFDANAVGPNPNYVRDYPDDDEVEHQRYLGDHSFTWVSLDELKAYPWDLTSTRLYGFVEAPVFDALKSGEAPKSYCGGVGGPGIVEYTPEQYHEAKKRGTLSAKPYVRASWTETAREATWDWPGKILPWLDSLAEGKPLRLILGFDS